MGESFWTFLKVLPQTSAVADRGDLATTPNTIAPDCIWTGGAGMRLSLDWICCHPTAQNSIPSSGSGNSRVGYASTIASSVFERPSSMLSKLNSPSGPNPTIPFRRLYAIT
jgi:hypothetical protein